MDQHPRSSVFGPLVCAGIYATAFTIYASVLRWHFGFPLDDSWIHQVIARNLVETHVLGFIPGVASAGSTSLLWTIIMAAARILMPGGSPVVYCAVISAVLLAGIGFLLRRLTDRDGISGMSGWCLSLGPATSGSFMWLGLTGMEHLLFFFLTLSLVYLWSVPESERTRTQSFLLLLSGCLIVLTRPEGIALIGLLLLGHRLFSRSIREWAWPAAGGVLAGVISACVNWKISGTLTPQTLRGRQLILGNNPGLDGRVLFVGANFLRVVKNWVIIGASEILHGRLLALMVVLAVLMCIVLVFAAYGLRAARAHGWLMLCVWGITIELMYLAILPAVGHGGRYVAIPLAVCYSMLFYGIARVGEFLPVTRRALAGTMMVVLGVAAVTSFFTWNRVAAADIDQINSEHGVMGQWLERNLPVGSISRSSVAAFDIGRIGYQMHGNLVDLGGLVDSSYLPFVAHRRTVEYLQQHGVAYVVLPDKPAPAAGSFGPSLFIDPAHGAELHALYTVCADPQTEWLAQISTGVAWPCQTAYAIQYIRPPNSTQNAVSH